VGYADVGLLEHFWHNYAQINSVTCFFETQCRPTQ